MVEGETFSTALLFLVILLEYYFFTNFISKLKEEQSLQLKRKAETIIKLEDKFLDFQMKMIALLTRFEQSLSNVQDHDMKNQQALKEVTTKIKDYEIKIENLITRLIDKLDAMKAN